MLYKRSLLRRIGYSRATSLLKSCIYAQRQSCNAKCFCRVVLHLIVVTAAVVINAIQNRITVVIGISLECRGCLNKRLRPRRQR